MRTFRAGFDYNLVDASIMLMDPAKSAEVPGINIPNKYRQQLKFIFCLGCKTWKFSGGSYKHITFNYSKGLHVADKKTCMLHQEILQQNKSYG